MKRQFEEVLDSLTSHSGGSALKIDVSSPTSGIDLAWFQVRTTTKRHQRYFLSTLDLGIEEGKVLSLHRWKIWWLIPRLLESIGEAAPETYFILCKLQNQEREHLSDQYIILLASMDRTADFSFEGGQTHDQLIVQGNFQQHGTSTAEELHNAVLIGRGSSPLELIKTCVLYQKKYLRELADLEVPQEPQSNPCSTKQSFVDWFGWCTWDSFYTDLSGQKVVAGLKSFTEHTSVRPRFLILDDGWQRTDVDHKNNGSQWGGRLASLHANFKFSESYGKTDAAETEVTSEEVIATNPNPNHQSHMHESDSTLLGDNYSLQALIEECKANHIDSFFVWHTLTGYWAGVSVQEGNHHVQAYKPKLVFPYISANIHRISVAGALHTEPFTLHGVGLIDVKHVASFFSDYHANLAAMGVDGVKVDAQSVLPLLEDERADGTNIPSYFTMRSKVV